MAMNACGMPMCVGFFARKLAGKMDWIVPAGSLFRPTPDSDRCTSLSPHHFITAVVSITSTQSPSSHSVALSPLRHSGPQLVQPKSSSRIRA